MATNPPDTLSSIFLKTLAGRELVDSELIKPSSFIGTQGWAQVVDGKLKQFIPMDLTQQPQQQQSVEPATQQEAEAAIADSVAQATEVF